MPPSVYRARLRCVSGWSFITASALLALATCAYAAPGWAAAMFLTIAVVAFAAGVAALALSLRVRRTENVQPMGGEVPEVG